MKPKNSQSLQILYHRSREVFQRYWLLRWTSANLVGWSGGLLLAALLLQGLGIIGALGCGAVLGAIVGITQAWALGTHHLWQVRPRAWLIASVIAGAVATLPVYLLGFILLLNLHVGLLLMGAIYGSALGIAQTMLLHRHYFERAILWGAACGISGAFCAPLLVLNTPLPIICAPGPIFFALFTGIALRWITQPDFGEE